MGLAGLAAAALNGLAFFLARSGPSAPLRSWGLGLFAMLFLAYALLAFTRPPHQSSLGIFLLLVVGELAAGAVVGLADLRCG